MCEGWLKTKFSLSLASICFAAMTFATHAAPASNILVVDRTALLEQSKAGEDIIRQVKAATDEVDKDLSVRNTSLQTEREYLQQRLAVISPQFRTKEVKDFDAKQKALQDLSQQKQAIIQAGFVKARSQIELLLEPILQGLMKQHGTDVQPLQRDQQPAGDPRLGARYAQPCGQFAVLARRLSRYDGTRGADCG